MGNDSLICVVLELMRRNEEDKIGERGERLLCFLANRDKRFQVYLENCLKSLNVVPTNCSGPTMCQVVNMRKTDVILEFDCAGSRVCIGVTLKTRRRNGRPDSHLDRRWLDEWRKVLNMPDDIYVVLREGILRLAAGTGKSLVPDDKKEYVKNFLMNNLRTILEESIRGGEHLLKIFGYIEYEAGKACIYLFRVDDIINALESNIRQRGLRFDSVIYLGDYMWIQRKGGNGRHVKKPKTCPDHPGNQLQVKIKVPDLVRWIVNNRLVPYCEPYCVSW